VGTVAHVVSVSVARNKQMKLSKEQLKQIIKEELEAVLSEEQMSVEQGIERSITGDAHPAAYAAKMAATQGGDRKEITAAIFKGLEEQGVDWKAAFKAKHPNRGLKEDKK